MEPIEIPVSPGELLDRIAILTIKRERIGEAAKRAVVERELSLMERARDGAIPWQLAGRLAPLADELLAVNGVLWDLEEAVRAAERQQAFDAAFVEAARAIYRNNDRRAGIKREINSLAGCDIGEVKSHAASG